jgi:hypothetical protein
MATTTRNAIVVLVAALIACTSASAAPSVTKKRLAITVNPVTETFQLSLSSAGSVARDAGRVTWLTTGESVSTRGGQRVRVWMGTGRFNGKQGALVLRFRWEWLNAGREYEAGVGTWTVVDGTNGYSGLNGSGKSAAVWAPGGPVASRMDGFVTG